jgi:hypothetical protein
MRTESLSSMVPNLSHLFAFIWEFLSVWNALHVRAKLTMLYNYMASYYNFSQCQRPLVLRLCHGLEFLSRLMP